MSDEAGETLQKMLTLIDNVNNRSMLNEMAANISVILAASLRRQGLLSTAEVNMISTTFEGIEAGWPAGRAEQAHKVLTTARAVWEAAEPKAL